MSATESLPVEILETGSALRYDLHSGIANRNERSVNIRLYLPNDVAESLDPWAWQNFKKLN